MPTSKDAKIQIVNIYVLLNLHYLNNCHWDSCNGPFSTGIIDHLGLSCLSFSLLSHRVAVRVCPDPRPRVLRQ